MDSNNSSLKIENRKKRMAILLFVLPALLVYTIFIIYPILATFNYSLFEWNGISKEKVFIGFENFKNLLYDSTFWLALKNNVYLILVSVFVQIPLGLIMALVLLSKIRGKKILKCNRLFTVFNVSSGYWSFMDFDV